MKFFVPHAKDEKEAAIVIERVAKFIGNPVPEVSEMIYSIVYEHNGKTMVATVGKPVDVSYNETAREVIAIFPPHYNGAPFKICLPNRGVARGEPIYALQQLSFSKFDS